MRCVYSILFLLVFDSCVACATCEKLFVMGKDKKTVSFSRQLLQDSAFMTAALAREQQKSSAVSTSTLTSINGDLPLGGRLDSAMPVVQNVLLEQSLLTKHCSSQDLRRYKSLLLLALSGMKEEVRKQLRRMPSDKAFLMAWMADYICSPKMKKLCSSSLPYHLVASWKNFGMLSSTHEFLNNVLHWSSNDVLWRMSKHLVPTTYDVVLLPLDCDASQSVVAVSSKTFLLQTAEAVYICSQRFGVWTKELLYHADKNSQILHTLNLGSARVAIISYNSDTKQSKFVVFTHVGRFHTKVHKLAKFIVSGKVSHAIYLANDTFVWSVQEKVFRAQWYKDVKNWLAEPCMVLTRPVKGLVQLDDKTFGVFSTTEVQIFAYQPLINQWRCQYNRLFVGGVVYGMASILNNRFVICVNRLLIFVPKKHHGLLREEACLGLPALGPIKLRLMHDSALILEGKEKTSVVLFDAALCAFIRSFSTQPHGSAMPFSPTQILLGVEKKVLVTEPFAGTIYAEFCGELESDFKGATLLDDSNAIVWSHEGKFYQVLPFRVTDTRVLLAAACMKAHRELKGSALPFSSKGWIAQACSLGADGKWLKQAIAVGYGAEIPEKEQCSIM